MSTEVTLPALGKSVTEGTIPRWLKAIGETVEMDKSLSEVSTDKVDTEVPSPVAGTPLEIRFNEDDVAEVGAILAMIGGVSEAPVPQVASTPQLVAETALVPAPAPAPTTPPAPVMPQAVPTGNVIETVLPVLGESVIESTVSRWLKAVGETIEMDEPLLEVSTDRVNTEIPSPVVGTLLEIHVAEDEIAAIGTVPALVGDAAVAPSTPAPAAPPTPAVTASATVPIAPVASAMMRRVSADEGVYVISSVRKLAAEHGVFLSSVQGTGVDGRIRKQDILDTAEAAKKAASTSTPTAAAVASAPATAAPQAAAVSEKAAELRGTTEKLLRMCKMIAERMTGSLWVTSQLTIAVEVDVIAIPKLRRTAKDEFRKREGISLSYLPFITKITTGVLKAISALSTSADFRTGTVTYASQESVGVTVDIDRGLTVPMTQDAGDLDLVGLTKRIDDFVARTRAGKVGLDELSGSTSTITSYGSAGTLFDTPIISLPQVVILDIGALVKRSVVVTNTLGDDTIAIQDMMYPSPAYDHHLTDGTKAARSLSLIRAHPEIGDSAGGLGL